jgi:hypothetical protein
MNDETENKNVSRLRFVVGGLIILFAVFLVVDFITQLINIDVLLQWWPVTIIVVGLFMVSVDKRNMFLGTALALAGVTVVISRLGLLSEDLQRVIQIIAVLIIGLAVLGSRLTKPTSDGSK